MPSGVKLENDPEMQSSRNSEIKGDLVLERQSSKESLKIKKSSSMEKKEAKKIEKEAREEGIEVVLGHEGTGNVLESKSGLDQNVFRHPQAVRPTAMRTSNGPPLQATGPPAPHHYPAPHPSHMPYHPAAPHHPSHHPYYPYPPTSGSWGYGPPPQPSRNEYPPPPRAPYPVPPYSASNSFEEGVYHHHTPHYSPHLQYPPPSGRYPGEEVNVISPNHKVNSPGHRPDSHYRPTSASTPGGPRHLTPPHNYYQYPPTSPVSRPSSQSSGAPRLRNYALRRGDNSYNRGEKSYAYEDGAWNTYGHGHPPPPPPPSSSRDGKNRHQAPIVADSFDSGHISRTSHPATPGGHVHPPPPTTHSSDPHYQLYGGGGSWGSFDSALGHPPRHRHHIDDHRHYGSYPPPESPYSSYDYTHSPGPIYHGDSFPSSPGYGPPLPPTFSYSFDDENARLLQDYNPDHDGDHLHKQVTPPGSSKKSGRSKNSTPFASNMSDRNALLPKAAEEIDFDVCCPPMEPITPESDEPLCESLSEVNSFDVLCGRGGGTNSQIGNRRFRQLVQEFQAIYLMAKRKEKPLLARTIVLIIRKRGGRFLKKVEETGQMFEVGDTKAEAKTSQALREGLDVRATKSAQSLLDKPKKKKKSSPKSPGSDTTMDSPTPTTKSAASNNTTDVPSRPTESPPTLPRLQGEDAHPESPNEDQLRKRRRIRSADRFFPDFCPPRAEIGQSGCNPLSCGDMDEAEDAEDDGVLHDGNTTPIRRNGTMNEQDVDTSIKGCAGIALDIVTGAATASFCLGPTGWRK